MKQLFVVIALVLAACSGSTADSTTTTVISDGQTGADAGVPGDLNPGGLDIRTLEMSDGTQITYGLILPADFDASRQYPVLLALPPGGQTVELMTSVAETTYLSEALEGGWVVITPAAPNGTLFFQGSETYIPEILNQLSWIGPEGGRYHLAGVSNGGKSAFRIAALNPDLFSSVLVFPGFPESDADEAALVELADLQFAMFVGSEDAGWLNEMSATRDTLEALGANVTLDVRQGEGHIMSSLSDGADIFEALENSRRPVADS
jgi:hypothetical protein